MYPFRIILPTLCALGLLACDSPTLESDFPEGELLDVGALALAADGTVEGHYLVRLVEGADPASVAGRHGLVTTYGYRHAITGFAAFIPSGKVREVAGDPSVLGVEPDRAIKLTAQTVPWGISRVGATTSSTRAGDGVGAVTGPTVFVIDTGIDARHPELNVVGHVAFVRGRNADCNGHGTHVAGSIGARDNDSGVVGVAPGVALVGVKVMDCAGSGTWSSLLAGMDYVARSSASAKVANVSLSGAFNQGVNDAAARLVLADVAVAVASGNDSVDARERSPASEPSVLTVGAFDANGSVTAWSNFGPAVDLAAPGEEILSTARGGGVTTMTGTSMASPHVAGALALYRARVPAASATQAQAAVVSAATASQGLRKLFVGNW